MLTLFGRMDDIPVGLKPRMRELSLGPWEPWGFHPWTFHDGSTWASLAFAGATVKAEQFIGWAGLTMQIDVMPVLGVFVDEGHRGGGRAELLVTGLLRELLAAGHLHTPFADHRVETLVGSPQQVVGSRPVQHR